MPHRMLTHRPRPARVAAAATLLAVAVAVLTACGGSSPDADADATISTSTSAATTGSAAAPSTSGGVSDTESDVVTVTAVDFSFSLDRDSVPAGTYELRLVNDGGASHDLVVERDGDDVAGTDPITPGDQTTLTVDLEPGEYVFYCSIANHRSMGMEITVTVT